MANERIEVRRDGDSQSVQYTKRWKDDGLTHRLTVEEVEGGFIVEENIYGHRKSAGEDSEYIDETKKKVTTENPLKKKKESEASELVKSLKQNFGDIQIM